LDHLLTSLLTSLIGSNFGFMWSTLWDDEASAVSSVFVYVMLATLGAGQFVNIGNQTLAVKIISSLSPLRYSVERNFRRIIKGQKFEAILTEMFGFRHGDRESLHTLIWFAVTFFVVGWILLVYRARRL